MTPDRALGYIFEKYINQKAFGAYYTPTEITEYLCEQTIHRLILERVNLPAIPGAAPARRFASVPELLMNLDARLCRELLDALPKLSILDPACGSGAFLVAAMRTLLNVYSAVTGKIEFLGDRNLTEWLRKARVEHPNLSYYIKKRIITDNLFGVDIMEEATEIARLRLFLALVSSVQTADQLEPLPNIDFNILAGNSLVGLLRVDEAAFEQTHTLNMFQRPYRQVVEEKNRLVRAYRDASTYADDLRALRDDIQAHRDQATTTLDDILLSEWKRLGIQYEDATWDLKANKLGKPKNRALTVEDIRALRPFHWGYEFDQVLNERGGFDGIITNPPWEIFKPNAKEFFTEYSDLVTKKKMRIEDFEREQSKLLLQPDVRAAWLQYLSRFPHQNRFYRNAPQYANQVSIVNGKATSADINLYKLFLEQCYNLLHEGGQCGMVIPSGIYTDLGSKQLRELLFDKTSMSGLFCFENRKAIFEAVDSRFKFVVLTFGKGRSTVAFPAAFMRHDVAELERFPEEGALDVPVDLVRRSSPDSLSVMEFKSETDIRIAEKMLRFPLLGQAVDGRWSLALGREFHMTDDAPLFNPSPGPGCVPLFEGKMIWQFDHGFGPPRYWVHQREARNALLAGRLKRAQRMLQEHGSTKSVDTSTMSVNSDFYRLAFRDIAASTNERCMISTVLPPGYPSGNTLNVEIPVMDRVDGSGWHQTRVISSSEMLFLTAVFNSFTADWLMRQKISAHLNMFYVYQLPVPRLTDKDAAFKPIAARAARLICTTPEFDDLAKEVGLGSHKAGATDPAERARLRAELDGLVAHLYGLTEEEFCHILGTFPLVEQSVKDAALDVYRELVPSPGDEQLTKLIAKGESERLEFKVAARWNAPKKAKDGELQGDIVEEVAGFMNSEEGGALLIGVTDARDIVGLEEDYRAVNSQKPGRDSYELFLRDVLRTGFSGDCSRFYSISFHRVGGHDICRINVKAATAPVYTKNGDFFIRDGNRKQKLTVQSAIDYIAQRWPAPAAASVSGSNAPPTSNIP